LRCIEANLRASDSIAEFLSLPNTVVETVMGNLVVSGQIAPVRDSAGRPNFYYALTERGKRSLVDLAKVSAEKRAIDVDLRRSDERVLRRR